MEGYMDRSDSIAKLAAALCEVQKTELFALTDKENPFFKRKYADLSSVWDAIRLPLTSNSLAITQTMANHNIDGVTIETTLMHASGEYISGSLYIKPEKNTPQGLGSAITYGRRYALMGIVGIAPEDDDGERAMARRRENKKEASKTIVQIPDVPNTVVKKSDTKGTETVEEFFARKKMSLGETVEFNDYLAESAKLLGMDMKTLKRNAETADDLEDMLESVVKRRGAKEQAKDNWWDQSKHWSFREKDALKELVLYGFGNKNPEDIGESKACVDNPGAYNVLKTALPETKKALVKKYDKMFGAGEFKTLIDK
jgi:hypothetical protein